MPALNARTYALLKRGMDLTGTILLGLLCAPLLLLIAGAVRIEGGAPVLFRQRRIGRQGRRFTVLKFRTLRPGPHDPTHPASQATRTGRWLRRWGLDELPQLWNVLRGEMSLVGPRPTLPEQVARYGPYERRRLHVRPGLTGWAQIHGRNALSWPERIALDVWYVEHRNLALDVRILLRTPRVLVTGTGVHGPDGTNYDFSPSETSTLPEHNT